MQLYDRRENENNVEYAYRVVRRNIMTLQMIPGTRISVDDIMKQLNMPVQIVREVTDKLEDELLMQSAARDVLMVTKIDISVFREGFFMRSVVEPKLIEQLAGYASTKGIERLNENLIMQKALIEGTEGDVEEFFHLDDDFHRIIYHLAGKPNIWNAVRRVCTHYDRIRFLDIIENQIDLKGTYEEHQRIADYLFTGIPEKSDIHEFYETHLGTYLRNLLQLMEEHPEYFVS
ncbi:GntR family transcriptional regulator [Hespellia stercorisuis]|uniref:DNA-binding transcriptional regulator, GntR family n=1 Tax=Hespellia stercorisuis DSM 15480 TaxID=1121950 RepID=A0A1M6Q320_9FIRM|nr:GntR family transcriptional regulator [Hespellia stercorisuis]SHK14649.1 DNA-binding transcriptional regulator, GntR family [Hespellia stercorisuis DSM 15480]